MAPENLPPLQRCAGARDETRRRLCARRRVWRVKRRARPRVPIFWSRELRHRAQACGQRNEVASFRWPPSRASERRAARRCSAKALRPVLPPPPRRTRRFGGESRAEQRELCSPLLASAASASSRRDFCDGPQQQQQRQAAAAAAAAAASASAATEAAAAAAEASSGSKARRCERSPYCSPFALRLSDCLALVPSLAQALRRAREQWRRRRRRRQRQRQQALGGARRRRVVCRLLRTRRAVEVFESRVRVTLRCAV